jgi:hypothetical protein
LEQEKELSNTVANQERFADLDLSIQF